MKIVFINNVYATGKRGGAEKISERIVAGLKEKGHEVLVVATKPLNSDFHFGIEKNVIFLPSRFFDLDKYPLWWRFFYHIFDCFNFIQASRVKKILLNKKPDLVITNNLKGLGFLLPGVIKKLKIKHIHILHDVQLLHPSGLMFWGKEKILESPWAKIYQFINRVLFDSPQVIVSPSKWLLDLHSSKNFFNNSKKKILPNYFKQLKIKSEQKKKDGVFKFLYVGQLEEHKGIKFLVKNFIEFLKTNAKAELIIIGPGSQEEDLRKISLYNQEIKILGQKNSQEIMELMQQVNCLMVPSLCYENSPTVIYEAISEKLPVIASRIGGITELIEEAGGLLFEPQNSADLLDKMNLIFTHREESDKIIKKESEYKTKDYISEILAL